MSGQSRSWFLAWLLLLPAAAIAVTWSVWTHIAATALRSQEQSHILLALPVAAWLVWLRRHRLRIVERKGMIAGPFIVLGGWVVSSVGFSSGIDVAWHAGALAMVLGAVISVTGVMYIRAFLPAVVALLFLLPIPGRLRLEIALPLQEISAAAGMFFLELVGVAAERTGNVLVVNGKQIAVAEACNGMRMVSALLLVCYAFAFSTPMRQSIRMVFIGLSPVIAIAVNLIRIMPVALMYGYADASSADLIHDLSGWAVLGVALLLLFGILHLLQWLEIPIERIGVRGV